MEKRRLIIDSAGAKAVVSSDEKVWLGNLAGSKFLKRYVPAAKISQAETAADCFLVLKKGRPGFSISYPRAVYRNGKFDEKDAATLIEFLLERAREEKGIYCLHSSSVSLSGKGVIFWGGASGLGKTRLALAMSSKFDADFYSDEKTLICLVNNKMVGGVRSAYLSKSHFKNRHGRRNFLDHKGTTMTVPVGMFVQPIVNDSKKLVFEKWLPKKFEWHLYEEFSRKIRGTSRRFFKNTTPAPSLDTSSLSRKRSLAIKNYVRRVPAYFMKGSETAIAKKIISLLKKR